MNSHYIQWTIPCVLYQTRRKNSLVGIGSSTEIAMIRYVSINRARPTMYKLLHHGIFLVASNESDAELMQYLFPVG